MREKQGGLLSSASDLVYSRPQHHIGGALLHTVIKHTLATYTPGARPHSAASAGVSEGSEET